MTVSRVSNSFLIALVVLIGESSSVGAFQSQILRQPLSADKTAPSCTRLHGIGNSRRRRFLEKGAGTAASLLFGATILNPPAEASYTAFTQREEDWSKRSEKGEIKISSASQLRAQLREIAPMNSEGSKIFCPNGESSAVTPLMENKCSERKALPSVYGRSEDAMGNSIPGFGGAGGGAAASASTLRAELGAQSYFREN